MIVGQQKDITRRLVNTETWMANQKDIESALDENGREVWYSVLTLIDTPGAYPGLEERGQGEAIARNIFEMVRLKVPIITIIVGEGALGALGIEWEIAFIC
jgi:acetyl-CoA carboxylase carboxyl transferase subunit alpha